MGQEDLSKPPPVIYKPLPEGKELEIKQDTDADESPAAKSEEKMNK
jgi:hypothetical protein